MDINEQYMLRALELAKLGTGAVSPNPLVGCVIVHDGRIIGEGWHQKYGQAHAEVNAIHSVRDKTLLPESTLYVTLEPCSHFGKTPPCADLLIREKVKRVVIANLDSNPLVSGAGIRKLESAGVEVLTGVLEKEGKSVNNRFFTFMEKRRPYVILKWAQTADGFIARQNFDSKWISNEFSRQVVHRWRAEEDAVLVGSNTALYDNPKLNVRNWTGRNPIRVVVDRFLKLPANLYLFDQSQQTICFNLLKEESTENLEFIKLEEDDFIQNILLNLAGKKIQSVIVEGGAQILNAFINANCWDEARVFISDTKFENGIAAPSIKVESLARVEKIDNDILRFYYPS